VSERSGTVAEGRGRLYFTVGLPQSGKSTFCNNWVNGTLGVTDVFAVTSVTMSLSGKVWSGPQRPRVVVGGDDFRHAVTGREFEAKSEAFVFAAMDAACHALLDRGFDVMVDDTATTEQTVERYLRIDPDAQSVFIDVDWKECISRAAQNNRQYLIATIHRQKDQLADLKADWPTTFARLKSKVEARSGQDVSI
jgi:hypothetical protein